ncbi:MAG: J domain-containing protein [Acidocella sp.]|nr:J domain-containing protein [Acidocella sp.]
MTDDPYRILKVSRNASPAEIRVAFLKLAKKYHPDLNAGNAKAEERFKKLNAAHAELTMRGDGNGVDGVGPDGEVLSSGDTPRSPRAKKYRSPVAEFFSSITYGILGIFVAIFKAIDTVLASIWTGVKILFAIR